MHWPSKFCAATAVAVAAAITRRAASAVSSAGSGNTLVSISAMFAFRWW